MRHEISVSYIAMAKLRTVCAKNPKRRGMTDVVAHWSKLVGEPDSCSREVVRIGGT